MAPRKGERLRTVSMAVPGITVVWALPVRAQYGAALFRSRCASCHSVDADQSRLGPAFSGILGRVSGSEPGAKQLQAMRDAKLTRDCQRLDKYSFATQRRVLGTTKPIKVPVPEQRASINDYLASLPGSGKAQGS